VRRRSPASVASAKADESFSSWSTSGRSAVQSLRSKWPSFSILSDDRSAVFSSGWATVDADTPVGGGAGATCWGDRSTASIWVSRGLSPSSRTSRSPIEDDLDRIEETEAARARSSVASSADLRPTKAAKASGACARQRASRMSSVPSRSLSVQNWYCKKGERAVHFVSDTRQASRQKYGWARTTSPPWTMSSSELGMTSAVILGPIAMTELRGKSSSVL
jgi:hypothetical protein